MKTELRDENAIEVLGPRLLLPQSLKRFLQQNLPEAF